MDKGGEEGEREQWMDRVRDGGVEQGYIISVLCAQWADQPLSARVCACAY